MKWLSYSNMFDVSADKVYLYFLISFTESFPENNLSKTEAWITRTFI